MMDDTSSNTSHKESKGQASLLKKVNLEMAIGDNDNCEKQDGFTGKDFYHDTHDNGREQQYPNDDKQVLSENTYSLIYTAKISSSAFALAMFLALFQYTLPIMALIHLIQFNHATNPLGVPNHVSHEVRVTGIMCLLLAISLFWDLMDAIEQLQRGPLPRSMQPNGGEPCLKFYFAFLLQFGVGLLFQITIFVLVVSASSVIDLFLNFAALEFITVIDEIVFALALKGYFSTSMKQACIDVTKYEIPQTKSGLGTRRLLYLLLSVIPVGLYGWIIIQQRHGVFDCLRLQVQFGDGFISTLPVFSGFYNYERAYHHQRPIFWDESKRAAFRYCFDGESGFWVFNYFSGGTINSIDDMCTNWIIRSPYTEGFDITEFPSSAWLTKRHPDDKLEFLVDYFSLSCADCDETNCNGECVDGQCVCEDGSYGVECQFEEEPCEMTEYDHRTQPFGGVGVWYSSQYTLMRKWDGQPAFKYSRPIYAYFHPPDSEHSDYVDILMNLGRRYFVFSMLRNFRNEGEAEGNETRIGRDIAEYLETVHPYYDWIEPAYVYGEVDKVPVHRPVFVSDALDIGTISDDVSPLDLAWSRVDHTHAILNGEYFNLYLHGPSVETILVCAHCSIHIPCEYGGTCNLENGTCACDPGFDGPLCEVEPPCIVAGNCT